MTTSKNFCDDCTSTTQSNVLQSLHFLKDEIKELYLPKEVPVIREIPTPLHFFRKWVSPNMPLLIKGAINDWPAVKKWNKEYFTKVLKDKQISVAVTPNGYADAISETLVNGKSVECFVLPEERLMTMSDFLTKLEGLDDYNDFRDPSVKDSTGVFYIQKQNSNLTEEFSELLDDIDKDLQWASESFSSQPSAINLWIGDERAITSLHKDPFENIYCVVSGYKDFILLPPTDRPWLPYKTLPVGQYKEVTPGNFDITLFHSQAWIRKDGHDLTPTKSEIEANTVPWIAIDPSCPNLDKYPLYENASPISVRVEKGDLLYLPSLWFHYVRQSHQCIAVNYWYEMELDVKFTYFQFLEHLTKVCSIQDEESN